MRAASQGPAALGLLLAGGLLSACTGGDSQAAVAPANPLAGSTFYVNPQGSSVRAVERLNQQGLSDEAMTLQEQIASRPSATWLTPEPGAVYAEAERLTEAARSSRTVPVLVAYNIPGRDCGQYSSGGADGVDDYLEWIGSLAAGIGDRAAVVVLEPDAVTHSLDGCVPDELVVPRREMLAAAVAILQRQPEVHVYLDGGNSSWVEDTGALADAMRESGAEEADGFALNVANFETTERSVTYGRELSRELDGAHFVVDTSRNGAGPPALAPGAASGNWCNPPGRRLGTPPTTRTGEPLVDALLWIKQPGDSDGDCGGGAPAAGTWWPRYAQALMGQPTG